MKILLTSIGAAFVFSAFVFPSSSRAALLWQADFSDYAGGASITTNDSTGASNTFSAFSTSGGSWINPSATLTARDASDPFTTGMYAEALGTGGTGSGNLTAQRQNMASFGDGDVRVLSLDMAKVPTSNLSFFVRFVNNANNTLGNFTTLANGSIPSDSLLRITAVYNQSGTDLTLPGTMGILADGAGAFYFRTEAGAYTLISAAAMSTGGTGFHFGWSSVGAGEGGLFDNVGFWSSASDTVNGVSVLELAPGSVVPEPGTMMLCLCAGAFILRRGRIRR